MNRFVISGVLLLLSPCVLAQNSTPPTQFIAARQPEVESMAEIFYNTHLDKGTWTQRQLTECDPLTHHAFVRFDSTPATGAPASFLAIYDLNHPPARSLKQPWQGGITFIRVPLRQQNRHDEGPSPDYLIVAFNRALKQERAANMHGQPQTPPQTLASARSIAACFIGVSGDLPANPGPADNPASAADSLDAPVSGLILPLVGDPAFARTQYINFDKDGLVLDAGVSVTPK